MNSLVGKTVLYRGQPVKVTGALVDGTLAINGSGFRGICVPRDEIEVERDCSSELRAILAECELALNDVTHVLRPLIDRRGTTFRADERYGMHLVHRTTFRAAEMLATVARLDIPLHPGIRSKDPLGELLACLLFASGVTLGLSRRRGYQIGAGDVSRCRFACKRVDELIDGGLPR